jgi:hypothetical protein
MPFFIMQLIVKIKQFKLGNIGFQKLIRKGHFLLQI